MYLDTLKVSTLEQTADQTTARGGKGNAELVAWDYGKTIDLNLEDALFTPASQSMMWGGKFGVKKPKIRGLWNPMVYPKDRYGNINYIKRTKVVYDSGKIDENNKVSSGFYKEDALPSVTSDGSGRLLMCLKVSNPFYVGPITNMDELTLDYAKAYEKIHENDDDYSPDAGNIGFGWNQYTTGNINTHWLDNEKNTEEEYYRVLYRNSNFTFKLQDYYPEMQVYRKSLAINDNKNIKENNDTAEAYYFTFITIDLIDAYEKILADVKINKANSAYTNDDSTLIEQINTFIDELSKSIKYMKAHENELGLFNEAHLISESVKITFLFMVEDYYKNNFFSEVTYDLNACETAYELYKYDFNDGHLKYKDLSSDDYKSKLICPLGYDTIEEKENGEKDLLKIFNWSDISSKVNQSNRPERAEIILENYGDFNYYNQPMGVIEQFYVGGNYLDTTIDDNVVTATYTRKVADNYENNKEIVMQYFDFYTDMAKKKINGFSNPYIVETNKNNIYLKKPETAYEETMTWSQVLENSGEVTIKKEGAVTQLKYFDGTYGSYNNGSVVNPGAKNTGKNVMHTGFFSKQRKVNEGNWYYYVLFNNTDENYKYEVKQTSSYTYDDGSEVYYITIPSVVKSNSTLSCYQLAELNVTALKNKVDSSNSKYQYVSPQFKVTAPSTASELKKICLYGNETVNSLDRCTNSKTAHSYIWKDVDLKMISFEGDQDIYYNEHANLRYRTPQNSSIKEIGIAQQGFYTTETAAEYTKKKNISFTFVQYVTGQNNDNETYPTLTVSLSEVLTDFNAKADEIYVELSKTGNKKKISINGHYYGNFNIVNADDLAPFKADKCDTFAFSKKAIAFNSGGPVPDGNGGVTFVFPSITITLQGGRKNSYSWIKASTDEITSVTSLERRFNEKESYGYFIKDCSPVVSFYKTIKTKTIGGNTNIIRVPVGDFYIVSDWNYDGSTSYDYPYAIESGMEDAKVLDRMEKCTATQTFAINTSRNVTMFNYKDLQAYSHTPLTVFIDPRTMKPYEPNSDTFTRKNGDVIEGTLRIIKKSEVYYKWTRTVAPDHNAVGRTITVNANTFPGTFRLVGETYARLRNDGKDQRYQFEIPLAKLKSDTNLTLQADGDPTTFGMSFKVLRKSDGQMIKFTQYNIDSQEYNGYRSGSTKVVATDVSSTTTDNEIAREVMSI